jgi:hypothetical protein
MRLLSKILEIYVITYVKLNMPGCDIVLVSYSGVVWPEWTFQSGVEGAEAVSILTFLHSLTMRRS